MAIIVDGVELDVVYTATEERAAARAKQIQPPQSVSTWDHDIEAVRTYLRRDQGPVSSRTLAVVLHMTPFRVAQLLEHLRRLGVARCVRRGVHEWSGR